MWYLYLDESGDLGFDFENKTPSQYFTVTILALRTPVNNRSLINAVKKTLRRKVNPKRKRKRTTPELKGSRTSLEVKEYFFRQVSGIRFAIYSLTLNKRRLYPELQYKKEITYNYLARLILDEIPFEHAQTRVSLIMDRRKTPREIMRSTATSRNNCETDSRPMFRWTLITCLLRSLQGFRLWTCFVMGFPESMKRKRWLGGTFFRGRWSRIFFICHKKRACLVSLCPAACPTDGKTPLEEPTKVSPL